MKFNQESQKPHLLFDGNRASSFHLLAIFIAIFPFKHIALAPGVLQVKIHRPIAKIPSLAAPGASTGKMNFQLLENFGLTPGTLTIVINSHQSIEPCCLSDKRRLEPGLSVACRQSDTSQAA